MAKRKVEDPPTPQPEGDSDDLFGPLEFVPRPISSRNKWPIDPVVMKLKETLPGGKHEGEAVRVPINKMGVLHKIHMALRHSTDHELNAKFRYKLADKNTLIVWAEKLMVAMFVAELFIGCATTRLERPDGATAQCQYTAGFGVLGLITAPFAAIDHKHCIEKLEEQGYVVKKTTPY